MEKRALDILEQLILDLFRTEGTNKLLAKTLFDIATGYARADLVRAFEDMEKRGRLLVRYTDEGNDWVHLTPEGASRALLSNIENLEQPRALPHPPKSST